MAHFKKWIDYCSKLNISPYCTSVKTILTFLHNLFDQGLSYSLLNTARSALSAFVTIENSSLNVGNHPWISRYLKGVFNVKPPTPRYQRIWDIRVVFNILRDWGDARQLTLKELTLKLRMLLALLGAARTQLLQAFMINKVEITDDQVIPKVDELMKQTDLVR